jgi:hypothetical protein
MRWAILFVMVMSSPAWAGQTANLNTIELYFSKNQILTHQYLAQSGPGGDLNELPLSGDIYEFNSKSPKKAFFYSLVLPGAGEYYAGSRIKPAVFLGIEAAFWTGYFVYQKKGNDRKKDFIKYADTHYQYWVFNDWWSTLDSLTRSQYSHTMPWDVVRNRPIFNREYYENIGKYSEFQVGWDDIGTDSVPPGIPGGKDVLSAHRNAYLNIRKQSNNYYQTANTTLMLIIGNHLISAFDAALTARSFNKGQKRFSLMIKTIQMNEAQVPVLTWNYKF